jgi:hypothetical protein
MTTIFEAGSTRTAGRRYVAIVKRRLEKQPGNSFQLAKDLGSAGTERKWKEFVATPF